MRRVLLLTVLPLPLCLFLNSCTVDGGKSQLPKLTTYNYHRPAYRPLNPDNVRVKVSLQNQALYVLEGDRVLLVSAVGVGTPQSPTPVGNFRVTLKDAERRNRTYGFWVNNATGQIVSGSVHQSPGAGWSFRGYPMPYWVEWMPAYGFHEGFVHLTPRSKGCVRVPRHVAPKFFALVKVGTPISIQQRQPEDLTIGARLARPNDAPLPNPDPRWLMSQAPYEKPTFTLFEEGEPPLLSQLAASSASAQARSAEPAQQEQEKPITVTTISL